jgi:hypothetical protein
VRLSRAISVDVQENQVKIRKHAYQRNHLENLQDRGEVIDKEGYFHHLKAFNISK